MSFPEREPGGSPSSRRGLRSCASTAEALVVWAIWGAIAVAVLVSYSRVDPAELYNVSRAGLAGGLSRSVTLVNFPIALVAVALVLVAVASLPRAAWWAAGPAIALCAVLPWVVDQDDLDARWVNAIPALGVLVAGGLTAAAVRRVGVSFAPPRPGDPARVIVAVVVLVLSLPWAAAELGFHFPGDVFMGEELGRERDGRVIAAVHLGHHHGMDGALLLVTALLLSRVRIPQGRLRLALKAYLGAMLAYGAMNFVQDLWHEQVVKRGWSDASIPSALVPGLRPVWLVIGALAAFSTLALLREDDRGRAGPTH